MTPSDRWRRIEAICHETLERDGPERAAFLQQACGDDHELRREVEALLAHARAADRFLGSPIAAGPLPLEDAIPIARQIALALQAAHARGIIHRDLKPSNVGLTRDGNVKVLDFGLAKAVVSGAAAAAGSPALSPTLTAPTQAGVILGTAAYMAPEQAKGRAADKSSDVWSFGCVVFEMLTGRRPFDGD